MKTKSKFLINARTKRFCNRCTKKTLFDYNYQTGHSYCSLCGEHSSSKFIENLELIKTEPLKKGKEPYMLKLMNKYGF